MISRRGAAVLATLSMIVIALLTWGIVSLFRTYPMLGPAFGIAIIVLAVWGFLYSTFRGD